MYRRQSYDALAKEATPGDWYLHLYHAQFGSIGYIDKVMSVYRRHAGGLWWHTPEGEAAFWEKHGTAHLQMFREVLGLYGKDEQSKTQVYANIRDIYDTLVRLDRTGTTLLEGAVTAFPDFASTYIMTLYDEIMQRKDQVDSLTTLVDAQKKIIEDSQAAVAAVQAELEAIHNSKSWKMMRRVSVVKQTVRRKK